MFAELRNNKSFSIESIDDFSEISVDNHSYLQEAIVYRPDLTHEILARDVPIDHQDDNRQSALQYAISRGIYDLSAAIIEKGANVSQLDKYGNDALWTAVMNPRPSLPLIELLVERGADPHRKNAAGRSSYDMAVTKKNEGMQRIFGD